MASLSAATQGAILANSFLGTQTKPKTAEIQQFRTTTHVMRQPVLVSPPSCHMSQDPSHALSRRQIFGLTASIAGATLLNTKTAFAEDAVTAAAAVKPPPSVPAPGNAAQLKALTTAQFQKLDTAARNFLKTVIAPLDAGVWLRLAFHDLGDLSATAGGPNGSVISAKELSSSANTNFSGQNVVFLINSWRDSITQIAGIPISNADVIQLSGAIAVEITGGPKIPIPLGRPDAPGTGVDPTTNLYNPGMDFATIKAGYTKKGLNTEDIVALTGAHTIGFFGAPSLTDRPSTKKIDQATPLVFDNAIYKQIQAGKAIFPSDNSLITNAEAKAFVDKFARDQAAFFASFTRAYAKMSVVGLKPSGA